MRTIHKGDPVYYWHSSSEVAGVIFVDWCRTPMRTGGPNTNKIGTGAIVWSSWRYDKCVRPNIPRSLRRGYNRLRPYWEMYTSYDAACNHDKKFLVKRPSPDSIQNKRRYNLQKKFRN